MSHHQKYPNTIMTQNNRGTTLIDAFDSWSLPMPSREDVKCTIVSMAPDYCENLPEPQVSMFSTGDDNIEIQIIFFRLDPVNSDFQIGQ